LLQELRAADPWKPKHRPQSLSV